jgi:hypothetical protein
MDCVFENRVLRTKFVLEREEVTGGWEKLGNEVMVKVKCTPNSR